MDTLRRSLNELERSRRYSGSPYPVGLVPFPFTLEGQGFFPGGDGLWRDDDPAAIRCASPHAFPTGGIMFLGNDFGTLSSFEKLRGFENPPTWRHLKRRLHQAQIPGSLGFYTNAYLGLRNDRHALASGLSHPVYERFCADFLAVQMEHQSPRLIVSFGGRPTELLRKVLNTRTVAAGVAENVRFAGRGFTVVQMSAPYSDQFKGEAERATEGHLLAAAWKAAGSL